MPGQEPSNTILFKITTRMKVLFSNYLGDYSYSFQGSSELICITEETNPQGILKNLLQLQLHDLIVQDTFDHDKGQKSGISGHRLHWRLSTRFFAFSPPFYVQFSETSPLKSGESSEKSNKNCVKSCHVCGCHGFFFGLQKNSPTSFCRSILRMPEVQISPTVTLQPSWPGSSGKEKAHKHKQIYPVTARVWGGLPTRSTGWPGVSRPVARGQKFMCCVRNPRFFGPELFSN